MPEENELVLATIKKILPYGAFCALNEYKDREAFLHVSEVAPRWIKNIHEFISEGQRYVMKVHHLDRAKNQVDISIKRVSDEEKRRKLESVQAEKRGMKLLEIAIKESKTKVTIEEALKAIDAVYSDVFSAFKEASETGEPALDGIDLPKPLKSSIIELAKKNIRKPIVDVAAIVSLVSYGSEGVKDVQEILRKEGLTVHYVGAPRYRVSLSATDYKSAEKKLGQALDKMEEEAKKWNCDFSFAREEKA
jgi:translation initiation factor 2 subunit 1